MHSGGPNAIPGDRISIFRREFCWHDKGIRKASLKGLFGPVGGKRRAEIPTCNPKTGGYRVRCTG